MLKKVKSKVVSFLVALCATCVRCGAFSLVEICQAQADAVSSISMVSGAYANASSEENSGLKFEATANKAYIDEAKEKYGENNVHLGMLIIPTDYEKDAAAKSKSFTIDGLNGYQPLANYTYYNDAENLRTVGQDYKYAMTVPKISETNYNRAFSARAYIKIVTENSEFGEILKGDGFEESSAISNAYVKYSDYSEANNSRSVYQVAYTAYPNFVNETAVEPILKKFLDKVAVLEYDETSGKVVVANNSDVYTSPYTLGVNEDGDCFLFGAKGLTYNGARYNKKFASDMENGVNVYVETSSEASINADGSVTLAGKQPGSLAWSSGIGAIANSYVAFEGNYGVGTYVDFTFTGNNMPQVCLFANAINGKMSNTNANATAYTGYVLVNGMYATNGMGDYTSTMLHCFGPYRMDGTAKYADNNGRENANYRITGCDPCGQAKLDANTTYRYTVGSKVVDGVVYIDVVLYNLTTKTQVCAGTFNTGKKQAEVEVLGGNIIALGAFKKDSSGTTFKYDAPYTK